MLPNSASGRKSAFRASFRPDSKSGRLQNLASGLPSAGRRADFEAFPIRIRLKSGPETQFSGPEALLHNIG